MNGLFYKNGEASIYNFIFILLNAQVINKMKCHHCDYNDSNWVEEVW